MPYVSAADFSLVRSMIAPERPQNDADIKVLENQIYSLNRQIKALPGTSPTPEFRALVLAHDRLLFTYRGVGGKRF
jgi:hypothetical protein